MAKYYKKVTVERAWEQPIITEDGILGGNTFAVGVAPNYTEYKKIYLSFQKGLSANGGGAITGAASYRAYIIYNPTPIKITNLHIKNVNKQQTKGGTVYGSNDGATWIKIKDYTNTQLASRGEWDLDLSDNNKFYHYYKVDNGNKSVSDPVNAWYLGEITITATQKEEGWQECTKAKYDQLPNAQRKIVTDTYASYSNTTANLYKTLNSPEYTSETQAQEGVNGIKFSPSNLYGMTNLSSYIRISQNQKVVFELPDNLVRVNYVHHKGYSTGQVMPPSNINQVDISNDGTNWTTVATYSMPTYGIAGDVENQLDLPKIKYIRFNFWFHGSGSPSYYGSGGVGSVYINCLIREGGKEKSVNLYYLGGR